MYSLLLNFYHIFLFIYSLTTYFSSFRKKYFNSFGFKFVRSYKVFLWIKNSSSAQLLGPILISFLQLFFAITFTISFVSLTSVLTFLKAYSIYLLNYFILFSGLWNFTESWFLPPLYLPAGVYKQRYTKCLTTHYLYKNQNLYVLCTQRECTSKGTQSASHSLTVAKHIMFIYLINKRSIRRIKHRLLKPSIYYLYLKNLSVHMLYTTLVCFFNFSPEVF